MEKDHPGAHIECRYVIHTVTLQYSKPGTKKHRIQKTRRRVGWEDTAGPGARGRGLHPRTLCLAQIVIRVNSKMEESSQS